MRRQRTTTGGPRRVRRDRIRNGADYLRWEPILCDEQRIRLAAVPAPARFLGKSMPQSLDSLSFEGLSRLWSVRTSEELLVVGASVLFGIGRDHALYDAPALQVAGFMNWLTAELQRTSGTAYAVRGRPRSLWPALTSSPSAPLASRIGMPAGWGCTTTTTPSRHRGRVYGSAFGMTRKKPSTESGSARY